MNMWIYELYLVILNKLIHYKEAFFIKQISPEKPFYLLKFLVNSHDFKGNRFLLLQLKYRLTLWWFKRPTTTLKTKKNKKKLIKKKI